MFILIKRIKSCVRAVLIFSVLFFLSSALVHICTVVRIMIAIKSFLCCIESAIAMQMYGLLSL